MDLTTASPTGRGAGAPHAVDESDVPVAAAVAWLDRGQPLALALIVGVEGPSYRPLGAAMVIGADGASVGTLSSGCLERDVIAQAQAAMQEGAARVLRYGQGSPFMDITLPCGGGLDIAILPHPDPAVLRAIAGRLARREAAGLVVGADGALSLGSGAASGARGLLPLTLLIQPQIRFLVFGKGPEASGFAALARIAGYPVELFSPDPETIAAAGFGVEVVSAGWPAGLTPDARTAVTLFFHDHDRELPLLQHALPGPAFYVGAQGSLRVHAARRAALLAEGMEAAMVDRLASPFGLIPSVRDARTLAVSVLADVLGRSQGR